VNVRRVGIYIKPVAEVLEATGGKDVKMRRCVIRDV
jgi:hypothetical protein